MAAVRPGDGPVAVTGASGYVGAHVVIALLARGFDVRACVTDASDPNKTRHLVHAARAFPGARLDFRTANLLVPGTYDAAFAGCCAVVHAGTPMGYGRANSPRQVYEGAVAGTRNVLESVERAGCVNRVVYTSSFAAVAHPAPPGYVFTEADWASDNRADDPQWGPEAIDRDGDIAYAMAKVETERMATRMAAAGRFDVVAVCPTAVLGPLLSPAHELTYSWQWFLGRMLAGKPCGRAWRQLWNIVDVRDVGEAHALIVASDICGNGDRYLLAAPDRSSELNAVELQAHLARLFPGIDVGGPPDEYWSMVERDGGPFDAPRAYSDRARRDLHLKMRAVDETLYDTGRTLIDLKLVNPRVGR